MDCADAWVYSTLDGKIYNGKSKGKNYGFRLRKGDLITLLLDLVQQTLIYKINGRSLGVAFHSSRMNNGKIGIVCQFMNKWDEIEVKSQYEID